MSIGIDTEPQEESWVWLDKISSGNKSSHLVLNSYYLTCAVVSPSSNINYSLTILLWALFQFCRSEVEESKAFRRLHLHSSC